MFSTSVGAAVPATATAAPCQVLRRHPNPQLALAPTLALALPRALPRAPTLALALTLALTPALALSLFRGA